MLISLIVLKFVSTIKLIKFDDVIFLKTVRTWNANITTFKLIKFDDVIILKTVRTWNANNLVMK